jgi:diguanylate cyclase (GGDEF)-like protein
VKHEVIICVDDEVVILNSLRSELAKHFSDFTIELAESAHEALEVIEELKHDGYEIMTVISDYIMPEMNGDELLINIHKKYPEIIKIMLTGQANIDGIANAINEANLYRYLGKPWEKNDLIMTITSAIKSYRDAKRVQLYKRNLEREVELRTFRLTKTLQQLKDTLEKKEEVQKKLYRLATLDPLTQIYNRRKFFHIAEKTFSEALQYEKVLCIMMIDLDKFKDINDTHGHDVGDKILIGFTKLVKSKLSPENDTFARFGGEEFVVMSTNCSFEETKEKAEAIREHIANTALTYKGKRYNITISIGLAHMQPEDTNIDEVIRRADQFLYRAKDSGRNRVVRE